MSASISLNNIVTKPAEGNGQLEKDDKGYYKVNLGGFNVFNLHNEFYRVKDLNAILNNKSSVFYKRLHQGYLAGEAEHPKKKPGMTPAEFYYRNLQISLENTSHHVRSDLEVIELDTPCNVPGAGKPVRIQGWIKPAGKHAQALQSFLDNPEMNTAFSIRAVTTPPQTIGGYVVKDVIEIITWDWVDIPGIFAANKWSTIAKENFNIATENYVRENYVGIDVSIEDILVTQDDISTCVAFEDANVKAMNDHIIEYVTKAEKRKQMNALYKW